MEVGCLVFNLLPDFFFLSFSLFLVYFTGGLFLFESETEAFDTGGTKLFFFFFLAGGSVLYARDPLCTRDVNK